MPRKKLDNNQLLLKYESVKKRYENLYQTLDKKIVTKKQINDNYFFNHIQKRTISNIESTFLVIEEDDFFN